MQIEDRNQRKLWTNTLLGLIPDAAIGMGVASLTSTGTLGFLGTFVGLQLLYFVIWIKNSVWAWLTFWISTRKQIAGRALDYLTKHEFPEPGDYIKNAAKYFEEVADNDRLPCKTRLMAASQCGVFANTQRLGKFQHHVRLRMAFEDAIEQYKRLFSGKNGRPPISTVEGDKTDEAPELEEESGR